MKAKELHCGFCGQTRRGLFCNLDASSLSRLDAEKSVHVYRRGQIIFYQGNPSLAVYCIHEGRVKLYKSGEKGECQVIRLLRQGEIVGFRALLANESYAATAEAIQTTTVCVIPRETMLGLLHDSPDLAASMMAKLAAELRISEEQMVSLLHHPVKQRAANLLLNLIDTEIEADRSGLHTVFSLQRNEMAQMIGTTPETLSRTLKDFAQKGIIDLRGRQIFIKDPAALRKKAVQ